MRNLQLIRPIQHWSWQHENPDQCSEKYQLVAGNAAIKDREEECGFGRLVLAS